MSNSKYPKYEKYRSQTKTEQKESLSQRAATLIKNIKRVIKIANKPDREEYFMVFKIVIIGLVVLGALSYVIQLIFSIIPIGA
ncbi:MAG: protein translocase SEC61 complex subunit gamma [Candidatus Lokiarchaeota archaeon]|nr:protein translocase SEC61 complex subunit gamma [Candidatus Lokiarchaeota archaeon]MBD3199932.1 protein translocase SEC61 complex subunit gamma [Candidatus Lokiarchaeota archaeon]